MVEIVNESDGTYSVRVTDSKVVAVEGLELSEANAIVALANRAILRLRLKRALEHEQEERKRNGQT